MRSRRDEARIAQRFLSFDVASFLARFENEKCASHLFLFYPLSA
jgi:hypothetical protein